MLPSLVKGSDAVVSSAQELLSRAIELYDNTTDTATASGLGRCAMWKSAAIVAIVFMFL